MTRVMLVTVVLAALAAPTVQRPAAAQGRRPKKEFVVAPDRAISVTRDVLGRQGFEVVRIEVAGNDRVIYYRRGNMGRGKGKGPDAILVDINVRLRL